MAMPADTHRVAAGFTEGRFQAVGPFPVDLPEVAGVTPADFTEDGPQAVIRTTEVMSAVITEGAGEVTTEVGMVEADRLASASAGTALGITGAATILATMIMGTTETPITAITHTLMLHLDTTAGVWPPIIVVAHTGVGTIGGFMRHREWWSETGNGTTSAATSLQVNN